ncbi:MAG TPA: hypothetical protein DC054_06935 [Blastocatellia bacterium]|nr:hypothetical protein [Blastocatellia bacterium]
MAQDAPQNVREAIGVKDPMCLAGVLKPVAGGEVPFYWWEWAVISMNRRLSCFLAISFPPNTVSEAFEQIAIREKDAKRNILKKLKDIYALNIHQPTRTEKLPDGSFIIVWRTVQRPGVLEDKIAWLRKTLSAPIQTSPANPPELKTVSLASSTNTPAEPLSSGKAAFSRHDNYATMKQTFRAAWPNLRLELHERGAAFYKDGFAEFNDDKTFFAADVPNDVVMALTDQTLAGAALELFAARFKCEPVILCEGYEVEVERTLDHLNTQFKLPLNVFEYGDFKRRFSEHWTNLSIELYDASPEHGGLGRGAKELAADFDMSGLTDVGYPLHDYISIATWGESLKGGPLSAAIKNERLGIYCQGNWIIQRLPTFQWAKEV